MPNIPLDWTTVDWTSVGVLSGIAFLAALLGNILIFKHRLWAAILAGLLFAAAYVFLAYYPHGLTVPGLKTGARKAAVVVGLNLTSPEIAPGATIQNEQVYRGFDCNGTNISPELRWTNPPSGTLLDVQYVVFSSRSRALAFALTFSFVQEVSYSLLPTLIFSVVLTLSVMTYSVPSSNSTTCVVSP